MVALEMKCKQEEKEEKERGRYMTKNTFQVAWANGSHKNETVRNMTNAGKRS